MNLTKQVLARKDLKAAGYSPSELKKAGYSPSDLKKAGFSAGDLKAAGFNAQQLASSGFSAKRLHDAGFNAADLKHAGFLPTELKKAGYTSGDLLRAGFTPRQSGYSQPTNQAVSATNLPSRGAAASTMDPSAHSPMLADNTSAVTSGGIPSINANTPEARLQKLEAMQQRQMNQQQRRDAVNQLQSGMMVQAQTMMGEWSKPLQQTMATAPADANQSGANGSNGLNGNLPPPKGKIYKAGTVMFAVIDTSVNSDEQTPIMAKIVTGPLKGSKLLGSFTRVDKKLLLSFNLLNVPSIDHSVSISAVAIDPDTARTALAGEVNNHYLLRYGNAIWSVLFTGVGSGVSVCWLNNGTNHLGTGSVSAAT